MPAKIYQILLTCLICALTIVSSAGGWDTFLSVDEGDNLGLYPSMIAEAHDDAGYTTLHLSYYDADNKALKYARVDNGTVAAVWVPDQSGSVGKYSSLALDADGTT